MTETAATLKKLGGVDLTKLSNGIMILVETTVGIYEIMVIRGSTGHVSVKGTVPPFTAHEPRLLILEKSIWDDKGEVSLPYWIGRGMRMVFRPAEEIPGFPKQELFATHSVESARVECPMGTWTYEVWEEN
jgi:hypothetical protein